MIDEINKIGEINSVNDLFDFKLSIKTIIILFFAWICFITIVAVFMLGGINNTIDYITTIMDETRQKIILTKNKKTTSSEKQESPSKEE
jgi:hypothetical protein